MKIDTRLAERLKKINPSSTLAITSKAKKLKSSGKDIVNFAAGEPDFDTPGFIKDAAILAINAGFTKYTPTTGIAELKKLICQKFKKDNALEYAPDQVIVSCGAKHAIYNALTVLLDPLDEVLIPLPYWVSYPEMVNLCGAVPRFIKTSASENFKINAKDLAKHITPKTKILIINSPSNPAGSVYHRDELNEIAKICVEKNIFVISDEIYEKIIYDGLKHESIASFNKDIYDLTITVNGLSKSHSMTGWRIGYLGAPSDVAAAISNLQDHSTSNPNSIAQKAAVAALGAPDDFSTQLCREFTKRRNYLAERIKGIKKMDFSLPQGAFYMFCDISETGMDSMTFAKRLLDEEYVSLIPGSAFGMDSYIRISFATSLNELEKGMDRIETWIKKL
ncbi:MAG: pyridoxal phosphate-dependent aminotransferase [Candidatus Omnitrophica bacterium]|jgi:aspartate aminotransferase|nr:pyridoxal phosphate-dependent aminotransferase [Candidatus Omnitrophota bacterium]MDD3274724.1 pyridoxal phosphate-dependent aminotransferase [Candidatus Omnitrophota bacterium]MDD5077756.1 pyridoxal phosphate-dependent aminotransferase [Candidatus Omnitrophota bacterium]